MKFSVRFVLWLSLFVFFTEKALPQQKKGNSVQDKPNLPRQKNIPVKEKDFEKVDSLASIAQPKAALALINTLNKRARAEKNTAMLIKSVVYRKLFQSYLEEDALPKILADLKQDIHLAKQPEKSVLQSLLAQTYWDYYLQNMFRISNRTEIAGGGADSQIQTWSAAKLADQTVKAFLSSLTQKELLQNTKAGILNRVLTGDSATRVLRPTLYDLLAHRALDVFINTNISVGIFDTDATANVNNPAWMGDDKTFLSARFTKKDSTGFYPQAIRVFQDLVRFHSQTGNLAALADVNLKRLKFFYEQHVSAEKEGLYEKALLEMEKTTRNTIIYSDVVYELARFYQLNGTTGNTNEPDLSAVLKLANKAIAAYPGSNGANNAQTLIAEIQLPSLQISTKDFNLPDKPVQLVFSYKNVDTVYAELYRVPTFLNHRQDLFNKKEDYTSFLQRYQPVKKWEVKLPVVPDYRDHNFYDQMDGMPPGNYVLIARTKENKDGQNSIYEYVSFRVTGMAVITGVKAEGGNYFITDSESGKPLQDVEIKEFAAVPYNARLEEQAPAKTVLKTNADGIAHSAIENLTTALVIRGGDSVLVDVNAYSYNYRSENKKVVLFTDRPIYRPGQTVFYKGVFLKYEEGVNTILPGQSVAVTFKDFNRKQVDSLDVTTNEYGTFQGSFAIPAGRLNGRMEINTEYGSAYINVEEYKRPTFEVLFDKDKQYKLNDSVQVKGKAVTFAGYPVAGAKLKYTVHRYRLPNGRQQGQGGADKQLAFGTAVTSGNGDFKISFFTDATKDKNDSFSFHVKAEVTDINGETITGNNIINLGKIALHLNISMPAQLILSSKTDTIPFTVLNGNREPVGTNLGVEWRALQYPGRLVNRSLFYPAAEKYSLSRTAYLKQFPYEEYNGDGDPQKWTADQTGLKDSIRVNGLNGTLKMDPRIRPGYYKVLFSAVNSVGDTLSADQVVRVYPAGPTTIQSMNEWLILEKNTIDRSESAIFRIAGALPAGKAWYEVYYKGKFIERVALKTSPKQQVIKIKPAPEFAGEFAVQFTLIENGRVYNQLYTIPIIDAGKELNVQFLTFRNKLQPGEKESWKIKISNSAGEKQMAEMVATLYDASLDQLKKLQWDLIRPITYNYSEYTFQYSQNNQRSGNTLWFLAGNSIYRDIIKRNYEQIDAFQNNYSWGNSRSYNTYLEGLEYIKKNKLAEQAIKKLALLKTGKVLYGVVTDHAGYALAGVSVRSGKLSAVTDQYGIFSINAKEGDMLQAVYLGYKSSVSTVTAAKRLDVVLQDANDALNEVVTVGYGVERRELLSSKPIKLRGNSSLAYDLESRVPGTVTIQSTKVYDFLSVETYDPKTGMMIINGKPVQTVSKIVPRTNFNETAFFYPQLHTNAEGEINIDFTVPQSITRYQMRGFVHTKDLKTALVSRELITQKQLAIAVNAPRFFRERDTILLSAKLNNLSGKVLSGDAVLELKDALTGKIINLLQNKENPVQYFNLADQGNEALKWELIIPSGISAITYKITAQSGDYSDGEEMTVPVLPNAMLVTETMPLNIRGNTSKTFSFNHLLQSGSSKTLRNQGLTVEFTANPVWYAVQALPYLMEYSDECAEQTFNRFYANSLATGIINSSPRIKLVFDQWKSLPNGESLLSSLEKNPELKSALLQETPWISEAGGESERKKRLAVLFDLNRMAYESTNSLEKLLQMQNGNGSFSWFKGMQEDRYMTQYIVLGLAQLQHLKSVDKKVLSPVDQSVADLITKSVVYLDQLLKEDYQQETAMNSRKRTGLNSTPNHSTSNNNIGYLPLHYLYTRSYLDKKSTDPVFNSALSWYMKKILSGWKTMDVYQQGQSALILYRSGNKAEALKIVSLLKDRAQQSEEMGMYWPANLAGRWWYQNPLETQALLIEVFDEVAGDAKSVEEMKIWLLKNKQTNDWKTTKATAAACYALLRKGADLLGESAAPEIRLGGKTFNEMGITHRDLQGGKESSEAGTGYQKIRIDGEQVLPAMGKVAIQNPNQTMAWGAVYWQYFEQLDQIKSATTGIKIKKQLFLQEQTAKGAVIKLINQHTVLRTGDLLKVRIEIYADRDMEYVHLKDMRAAGFEPVNIISKYKYQDGIGYYETTKDASSNFFINYLRKGVYVFEYDLRVTHAGNFSNGVTTMQCMYAPEFTTHSAGVRVAVKP